MDILALDTNFNTLCIVDMYESMIWTDRYDEYGDFELYLSPYSNIMEYLIAGNYLWRKDSDHLMIIKKIEILVDIESGAHATVTGESLESILKDRVIEKQTVLSGSLQNGIKTLLNQTIISPSDSKRRISNFIFKESSDSEITKLTLDAQYFGENLYDVISDICYSEHIGFKITLDDQNHFVFELYKGTDRSYDQTVVPYVVFSPSYDNLLNSDYVYDVSNIRNVAYIAGEEPAEDSTDVQMITSIGDASGLGRKEVFVDASNLRKTYEDDEGNEATLTDDEYQTQLQQRGTEELAEYYAIENFDGQIDNSVQWILNRDFFMGDIVQIENEYGMTAKSRVIEMITSESTSGIEYYPSFESVLDDES